MPVILSRSPCSQQLGETKKWLACTGAAFEGDFVIKKEINLLPHLAYGDTHKS